jgi:hypothetical protein
MDENERIWSESEILQVLAGLMQATEAVPWPVRFLMRPWNKALIAAGAAFAGDHALEKTFYGSLEQSMLEDFE